MIKNSLPDIYCEISWEIEYLFASNLPYKIVSSINHKCLAYVSKKGANFQLLGGLIGQVYF